MADTDPYLVDLEAVLADVRRVLARTADKAAWRDVEGRTLSAANRAQLDALQALLGDLGREARRLSIPPRDLARVRAAYARLTGGEP